MEKLKQIKHKHIPFFWWAILSGILFGLSLIDIELGFLSFFAFAIYLSIVIKSNSKQSFLYGLLFGFVLSCITLYSTILVKVIAFIGLLIAMPLYFGIITLFIKKVQLRFTKSFIWFFPIIWIAFEYFMTLGPLNFPWHNVGYSLANYYYLIQFADIFGIYGISFIVLIINILIYRIFSGKFKDITFIIIIFMLWFGYGFYKDKTIKLQKEDLKIGIVQLNILQEDKWNPAILDSTIVEYAKQVSIVVKEDSVDLVIFPESAITTHLLHEREYKKRISNMAISNKVNLIIGFPDYEVKWIDKKPRYEFFNSATMVDKDGNFLPKYDKIRLVPFGERIPFLRTFPILEKLQFGQANFEYGKNPRLYPINDFQFPILICFEGVFPELSRQYVRKGADFIVVITNDGWFQETAFPKEHANNTKIRAVENRVSLFRAANTGISYIVNPKGQIIEKTEIYEKENISDFLFTSKNKFSFFVKVGYIFPIICFWVSIILIIYAIFSKLILVRKND
ncbi:MAG: apolipoprotein N-acyltransferase [Candidatus Cloacimonetes bacterium]|nr:apolipoprotein N-acyltransferase [Candidatus Cloacimonadota bacterium]